MPTYIPEKKPFCLQNVHLLQSRMRRVHQLHGPLHTRPSHRLLRCSRPRLCMLVDLDSAAVALLHVDDALDPRRALQVSFRLYVFYGTYGAAYLGNGTNLSDHTVDLPLNTMSSTISIVCYTMVRSRDRHISLCTAKRL